MIHVIHSPALGKLNPGSAYSCGVYHGLVWNTTKSGVLQFPRGVYHGV